MSLAELSAGDRSSSTRNHLARVASSYSDIDGLMQQFRKGKPLPEKVMKDLRTEAQLVVLSAERLHLPLDIKALRKVVLTTHFSELPQWTGAIHLQLQEASGDWKRCAHLRYVESLAYTRQFQDGTEKKEREQSLKRAKDATEDLTALVKRASLMPPIWSHVAQVNNMSLAWQLAYEDKVKFEDVLQQALPVYQAAAEAFSFWVGVRRDQLETLALLRARGLDQVGGVFINDSTIDHTIFELVAQFKNLQGIYCMALIRENLEAEALEVIASRPVYKKLCKLFPSSSMSKLTRDVLLDLKSPVL